jgi:uncharacterized membrane protein YphA (DoxX/SURF4 family)
MKHIVTISRVVIGSLFIVSGLIKANDPLGFSFKLDEYFKEAALNLPFLEPYALVLAVLVAVAEIVLGFAVLFGGKIKIASWSLLVMLLFFGWLTFYTATCDPHATYTVMQGGVSVEKPVACVTDCGCFGDAMKGSIGRSLTPWESFSKDMILLILLIPVFFKRNSIKLNNWKEDAVIFTSSLLAVSFFSWIFTWYFPIFFFLAGYLGYMLLKKMLQEKNNNEWIVAGFVTLITLGFVYYTYSHLPIRDYRPYKIGNNIAELRKLPPGSKPDIYMSTFQYRNKTTGKVEEFTEDNYPWADDNYEFVDRVTKLVQKGDEALAADFKIFNADNYEITEDILNEEEYVLLLVSYDIKKADKEGLKKFSAFAEQANKSYFYNIYGISSSPSNVVEDVRHEVQATYDFYVMDEITLKTVIRSNPGLVLLKKGVVVNNWHYNDFPTFTEFKDQYLKK